MKISYQPITIRTKSTAGGLGQIAAGSNPTTVRAAKKMSLGGGGVAYAFGSRNLAFSYKSFG